MSHPYVDVGVEEPEAALRVKRWKAHCRRLRQATVIVVRSGPTFALEVWGAPNCLAELESDMLTCHPDYEFVPFAERLFQRNCIYLQGLATSRLATTLAIVYDILETCGSGEMRQAVRRPVAPVVAEMEGDLFDDPPLRRVVPEEIPYPRLQLALPDREYECWQACLDQIFGLAPRPLPLAPQTANLRDTCLSDKEKLHSRFDGLCPQVDEQWRAVRLSFLLESRFKPGFVELREDGIRISRPGFSQDGNQAAFWLNGPLLTEEFEGMVRAHRDESGWRVVELSHDADWNMLGFEAFEEIPWFSKARPIPDWRWACAPYDEPSRADTFYTYQEWQACEQEYADLIAGEDSRSVIPVLHGPALSVPQLRKLGQEQEEILWTGHPSSVSAALALKGHAVVHWGKPGDPEWLGKLLYHLNQIIPCRRLESTWISAPREERDDPHRASILRLLEAIFRRAGCAPLQCRLWNDKSQPFAWQEHPGAPARICGAPGMLGRPGTLWVRIPDSSYRDTVYELLGPLCQWADPESRWSRAIWRAALLESAWSGIEED